MLLETLGIYGWKESDENLLLASLLTGDPLLMIGHHGCAKTHIAHKMAQAMQKKYLVYDASKAMFEDVLGYPNIEKLKQGVVEYISSPVTVWDKEWIMIDELNRAMPELQSKWLELIRSRAVMGFSTQVKWVWSAMNPKSYSATQALDEALIGRFALFLYPPDVLQMEEQDRIRVTTHINGDDAPSLSVWLNSETTVNHTNGKTVPACTINKAGQQIESILRKAAVYFMQLQSQLSTLSGFLSKFAVLLVKETNGEITLDGRRLGFIYRNLLANRAVELAKLEISGSVTPDFAESAKYVMQSSIPVGLNDESVNREEAAHKMDICFDLLREYFSRNAEISIVNKIYELFTTNDLLRKAELLLQENVGEMAASKAWNELTNQGEDITLLAYTALQVEVHCPGTVPQELLETLSNQIQSDALSTRKVPSIQGESIEHLHEIEALLEQDTDLGQLAAFARVNELAKKEHITLGDIHATKEQIAQDVQTFTSLMGSVGAAKEKGGETS
jgi:hypothetical protein